MTRSILILLLTAFSTVVSAQKEIIIDDFSEKYYAKLYIDEEKDDDDEENAELYMYEKISGKELFNVSISSHRLDYESLQANELTSNVLELPYGFQSIIIHQDFNFDGIDDFAIRNGYFSCYGGPSFDIFLAEGEDFIFSKGFTRLAHEYCGMFEVDSASERISVMTKSGCCWHQYSEFIVEDNEPKEIRTIIEDAFSSYGFLKITESIWNGTEMVETTKNYMFPEEAFFYFQIEKNNKKVILSDYYSLRYVFTKEDGEVEFAFPEIEEEENGSPFTYSDKNNMQTLIFSNASASYTIYETDETVGIKVETKGKTYDMQGDKSTQKGRLKDILEKEFDNLIIK